MRFFAGMTIKTATTFWLAMLFKGSDFGDRISEKQGLSD